MNNMQRNAPQDQYTFGVRPTDHQTRDHHTYAADARRPQRGQNPNSTTAALCPMAIRVPLLQRCISKLADSQALGALRACGCSAVGGHSKAKFQAQGYRDRSGTVALSKTYNRQSRVPKACSSSSSSS